MPLLVFVQNFASTLGWHKIRALIVFYMNFLEKVVLDLEIGQNLIYAKTRHKPNLADSDLAEKPLCHTRPNNRHAQYVKSRVCANQAGESKPLIDKVVIWHEIETILACSY